MRLEIFVLQRVRGVDATAIVASTDQHECLIEIGRQAPAMPSLPVRGEGERIGEMEGLLLFARPTAVGELVRQSCGLAPSSGTSTSRFPLPETRKSRLALVTIRRGHLLASHRRALTKPCEAKAGSEQLHECRLLVASLPVAEHAFDLDDRFPSRVVQARSPNLRISIARPPASHTVRSQPKGVIISIGRGRWVAHFKSDPIQ